MAILKSETALRFEVQLESTDAFLTRNIYRVIANQDDSDVVRAQVCGENIVEPMTVLLTNIEILFSIKLKGVQIQPGTIVNISQFCFCPYPKIEL